MAEHFLVCSLYEKCSESDRGNIENMVVKFAARNLSHDCPDAGLSLLSMNMSKRLCDHTAQLAERLCACVSDESEKGSSLQTPRVSYNIEINPNLASMGI